MATYDFQMKTADHRGDSVLVSFEGKSLCLPATPRPMAQVRGWLRERMPAAQPDDVIHLWRGPMLCLIGKLGAAPPVKEDVA